MSGKIRGKDLSYDTTLPPFLQKLHAQTAGLGDADRHEHAIARPKRIKEINDEDDPTVVDDDGEVISKEDLAKRMNETEFPSNADEDNASKPADEGEPKAPGALDHERPGTERGGGKVTDGLSRKKRKAVKIVDDDDHAAEGDKVRSKNVKKAKKPIKLAFDDND